LILVEGETEVWYFQMMKRHKELKDVKIEPELPQKRKLEELFKEAKDKAKDYDRVFVLIDFDKILQDNAVEKFKQEIRRIRKNRKISLLVNNPCLEFWFLLHFKETGKGFINCAKVTAELRKYLSDYEKNKKYFTGERDIYGRLKDKLERAIKNGKRLGEFDINNPSASKAEIYRIFEEIG